MAVLGKCGSMYYVPATLAPSAHGNGGGGGRGVVIITDRVRPARNRLDVLDLTAPFIYIPHARRGHSAAGWKQTSSFFIVYIFHSFTVNKDLQRDGHKVMEYLHRSRATYNLNG